MNTPNYEVNTSDKELNEFVNNFTKPFRENKIKMFYGYERQLIEDLKEQLEKDLEIYEQESSTFSTNEIETKHILDLINSMDKAYKEKWAIFNDM